MIIMIRAIQPYFNQKTMKDLYYSKVILLCLYRVPKPVKAQMGQHHSTQTPKTQSKSPTPKPP